MDSPHPSSPTPSDNSETRIDQRRKGVARCVNVNTYHVRREFKFKFKLIFFFLIFIFFFIITAFLTFFAMLYSDKHG